MSLIFTETFISSNSNSSPDNLPTFIILAVLDLAKLEKLFLYEYMSGFGKFEKQLPNKKKVLS